MTKSFERQNDLNGRDLRRSFRKRLGGSEAIEQLSEILGPTDDRELGAARLAFLATVGERSEGIEPLLRSVFAHIGSRWGMPLIVCFGGGGPFRFSTLLKLMAPISKRVLTLNLRILERDGLISRTTADTKVLHVEYQLTPLGRGLFDIVWSGVDWTMDHAAEIAAARARFDDQQG